MVPLLALCQSGPARA